MLSYAGVTLPVPTDEFAAWVENNISVADIFDRAAMFWPGGPSAMPFFSGVMPTRPVKIGCLWWPRGASRWAVAHFLVDEAIYATIRQQVFGGTYTAWPLVMSEEDCSKTVSSITANMWALPSRPLSEIAKAGDGRCADGNGSRILTLVDERFFWWLRDAGYYDVNEGTTTWANLYTQLATQLGLSIATDTIAAAYLKPSPQMAANYQASPLLLDAVAANVGHRIVRRLDGTVLSRNHANSLTDVQANLQISPLGRQAGGHFYLHGSDDAPAEANAVLASGVKVSFPKSGNAAGTDQTYPLTATLAALALTQFPNVQGNPFATKTFNSLCTASFAGGGTPTNLAELQALVNQVATDYYLWTACPPLFDTKYAGIVPWVPEAKHASIEWTVRKGEVSTRIQPGLSEYDTRYYSGTFGSQSATTTVINTPSVVNVTNVTYSGTANNQVLNTYELRILTTAPSILTGIVPANPSKPHIIKISNRLDSSDAVQLPSDSSGSGSASQFTNQSNSSSYIQPGGWEFAEYDPSYVGADGTSGRYVMAGNRNIVGGWRINYQFSTTTTAPPASGGIRYNNATQASATVIYIRKLDLSAVDETLFLLQMRVGVTLMIALTTSYAKKQLWTITSVTDNGTYYSFGVTFVSSTGNFANADNVTLSIPLRGYNVSLSGPKGASNAPSIRVSSSISRAATQTIAAGASAFMVHDTVNYDYGGGVNQGGILVASVKGIWEFNSMTYGQFASKTAPFGSRRSFEAQLYVNGAATGLVFRTGITTANTPVSATLAGCGELALGDFCQIQITNISATKDLDVTAWFFDMSLKFATP